MSGLGFNFYKQTYKVYSANVVDEIAINFKLLDHLLIGKYLDCCKIS